MLRQLFHAWKGWLVWKSWKLKYRINYDSVVLVPMEKDIEWNREALKYLPDYMERKRVTRCIILTADKQIEALYRNETAPGASIRNISSRQLDLILEYYCFCKFFDNIVFLSLDRPRENMSSLILQQGCVSKRELICLCFYHLREVPSHE